MYKDGADKSTLLLNGIRTTGMLREEDTFGRKEVSYRFK